VWYIFVADNIGLASFDSMLSTLTKSDVVKMTWICR